MWYRAVTKIKGVVKMNIGKACAIFKQINSENYTYEEKVEAIYHVLDMPTHNGITKDEILAAFKWLFDQNCEVSV